MAQNVPRRFNPSITNVQGVARNPVLIKPVFDVGNYGHDVTVPLSTLTGTNTQTVVPSTSIFVQVLEDSRVPVDEVPIFISESDVMQMIHQGNDSNYDETFTWLPDMSANLYKATLSFAVGLNVSSYSSGNFKISQIKIVIKQQKGEYVETLVNTIIDPGMANIASAVGQVAIVTFDTQVAKKIFDKSVTVQIVVTASSGSGTFQCGIFPVFCYIAPAVPKVWTTSALIMHLHGALDHAFPVFRNEDNENLLDHSGVGI